MSEIKNYYYYYYYYYYYLSSIPDLLCSHGYNNSLYGGAYLQRWTLRDKGVFKGGGGSNPPRNFQIFF